MASDPFTIEPPRWLQEITRPVKRGEMGEVLGLGLAGLINSFQKVPVMEEVTDPETGQTITQQSIDPETGKPMTKRLGFSGGIAEARMNQADPMWRLKASEIVANIQGQRALASWRASEFTEKAKKWRSLEEASPIANAWTAGDHKDPPPVTGVASLDSQMQGLYKQQKALDDRDKLAELQRQNSGVAAKIELMDTSDFLKRLGGIDPASRAEIKGMTPGKNGEATQAMWTALGFAEQAAELHKKNLADQAALEAQVRGDAATTRVDSGGKVVTTYSPKKVGAGGDLQLRVEEKGGHTFVLYGKSWKDVTDKSPIEKAEIGMRVHWINALQTELSKFPEPKTPQAKADFKQLQDKLDAAKQDWEEYHKTLGPTKEGPMPTEEQPAAAPPATAPRLGGIGDITKAAIKQAVKEYGSGFDPKTGTTEDNATYNANIKALAAKILEQGGKNWGD
jgi:hypothetical protein